MKKILKILLIILLVFTFFYVCSYTTEAVEDGVVQEEPTSGLSTLSTSLDTNVSPLTSYSQANLELNNILCVILIAIGIVIILLAIAILIKLKK